MNETSITNSFIKNQLRWLPEHPSLNNEMNRSTAIINPEEVIINSTESQDHIRTTLFNLGSLSKVFGFGLLIRILHKKGINPEDKVFEIHFDDVIEAIWRGQIDHFIGKPKYDNLLIQLGLDEKLVGYLKKESQEILDNPTLFAGSDLEKIKDGALENKRKLFESISVNFKELVFFGLTLSSNASYINAMNYLCKLYREEGVQAHKLADLQGELERTNWTTTFEFINTKNKFKQERPNSGKIEDITLGFQKLISEWIKASNENTFAKVALESIKNNEIYQECDISTHFRKWQEEGRINSELSIYEKTGISVTITYGKEFESLKFPPHITFCTAFCIAEKSGKTLQTIAHNKTIAVLLPDVEEPPGEHKEYIRRVKDTHLPQFINELEIILQQLNILN